MINSLINIINLKYLVSKKKFILVNILIILKNIYILKLLNEKNDFLKICKIKNLNNKTIKIKNLIYIFKYILLSSFLKKGKKYILKNIIFKNINTFFKYKKKNNNNLILIEFIKNIKHNFNLKKIYKSGKKYQIPYPLIYKKKLSKFFKMFLKDFIKINKNKSIKNIIIFKLLELIYVHKKNNENILKEKKYKFNILLKENQLFLNLIKKKKKW